MYTTYHLFVVHSPRWNETVDIHHLIQEDSGADRMRASGGCGLMRADAGWGFASAKKVPFAHQHVKMADKPTDLLLLGVIDHIGISI